MDRTHKRYTGRDFAVDVTIFGALLGVAYLLLSAIGSI
jgi:hypothetical protein